MHVTIFSSTCHFHLFTFAFLGSAVMFATKMCVFFTAGKTVPRGAFASAYFEQIEMKKKKIEQINTRRIYSDSANESVYIYISGL